MVHCLIALGSNQGDSPKTLSEAVDALGAVPGVGVVRHSSWHVTPSVGGPGGQPDFLNGAAVIETQLEPQPLLEHLHQIERRLGRRRRVRWDRRTLDLDLLLYGEEELGLPGVTVPHPRMSFRRFVLEPAAEVAGDLVHPTSGKTIAELLAHLDESPQYVVTTSNRPSCAAILESLLHQRFGCPMLLPHEGVAEKDPGSNPDPREFRQSIHRVQEKKIWEKSAGLVDRLSPYGSVSGGPIAPVVSSFWLPAVEALCGTGSEVLGESVRPALVIAWLTELDGPGRGHEWLSADALRGLLRESVRGPLLVLDTDDTDEAKHEAVAAVEAAWPGLIKKPNEE